MSLIYRRLSRLPVYVRAFGVASGVRLLLQIEKRFVGSSNVVRPYKVPSAYGPIWLRDSVSDHSIFWQNIVSRQYDIAGFPHAERLMTTYNRALAEGRRPLIIDCGGNIGLSAIFFALTFPKAKVVVIEPELQNFQLLQKNVEPYRDIIEPIHGGIWSSGGWLSIENPDSGAAAFRVRFASNPTSDAIKAFTIDELLARVGGEEALIVKLDIEGSQKELFAENTDWVRHCHLITLELDDCRFPWTGTSQSFFKCLSQYPFEYVLSGEHVCCFRNFSGS